MTDAPSTSTSSSSWNCPIDIDGRAGSIWRVVPASGRVPNDSECQTLGSGVSALVSAKHWE